LVEVEFSGGRFEPVAGTEKELPCQLVLLALGFTGAERGPLLDGLGVEFDERGNVARDGSYATTVPGVFVAGDMGRGQSLIVWAIAEGRSCAAAVDRCLVGESALPVPIAPTARPLA
jgi:glutamate synthase (NADPH/NADH) small chain